MHFWYADHRDPRHLLGALRAMLTLPRSWIRCPFSQGVELVSCKQMMWSQRLSDVWTRVFVTSCRWTPMYSDYSDGPYNVSTVFSRVDTAQVVLYRSICAVGDVVLFMGKIPLCIQLRYLLTPSFNSHWCRINPLCPYGSLFLTALFDTVFSRVSAFNLQVHISVMWPICYFQRNYICDFAVVKLYANCLLSILNSRTTTGEDSWTGSTGDQNSKAPRRQVSCRDKCVVLLLKYLLRWTHSEAWTCLCIY